MKKLGLLILALTSLGLGSSTVVAQANTNITPPIPTLSVPKRRLSTTKTPPKLRKRQPSRPITMPRLQKW